MADMMSTLKGFLGDDAEDKIKNAMNMLSESGLTGTEKNDGASEKAVRPNSGNNSGTLSPEGLEMLMQLKGMADKISTSNDSRSNLLMSLRPFMRSERQRSIDKMVKLMNLGRISGLFGR